MFRLCEEPPCEFDGSGTSYGFISEWMQDHYLPLEDAFGWLRDMDHAAVTDIVIIKQMAMVEIKNKLGRINRIARRYQKAAVLNQS